MALGYLQFYVKIPSKERIDNSGQPGGLLQGALFFSSSVKSLPRRRLSAYFMNAICIACSFEQAPHIAVKTHGNPFGAT